MSGLTWLSCSPDVRPGGGQNDYRPSDERQILKDFWGKNKVISVPIIFSKKVRVFWYGKQIGMCAYNGLAYWNFTELMYVGEITSSRLLFSKHEKSIKKVMGKVFEHVSHQNMN